MRTIAARGKTLFDEAARSDVDRHGDRRRALDIVLPPAPVSVSAARHAVAELLLHGAEPAPLVVVEDVLLLVSELVTNAVLHAATDTRVSASLQDGTVCVAVGDDDPVHAPFLAERGSMATNGRGVMLVDALATDWGIDLRDDSKVVWFEVSYDELGVTAAKPERLEANGQPPAGRPRIRRPARSA